MFQSFIYYIAMLIEMIFNDLNSYDCDDIIQYGYHVESFLYVEIGVLINNSR